MNILPNNYLESAHPVWQGMVIAVVFLSIPTLFIVLLIDILFRLAKKNKVETFKYILIGILFLLISGFMLFYYKYYFCGYIGPWYVMNCPIS